jgi:hypothetical protein
MVMLRMKNVVNAMTENQSGDDVKEETNGGNDKDEPGIFDRWMSFHESILLTMMTFGRYGLGDLRFTWMNLPIPCKKILKPRPRRNTLLKKAAIELRAYVFG